MAAAPTFERIRRDKKRAPVQLQPLLAYLEDHLFDPDLDANQLKRACGVRDNSLPIYFHHALSLPPYAYIEDCRLEVACRLLRDTDLKVWQIAQLLGYSTLQVFSRAFDRWSGLRPSVFRRRSRLESQDSGNGDRGSAREAHAESSVICLTTLRKAVSGGLDNESAEDLARHLTELYPDAFRRSPENATPSPGHGGQESVYRMSADDAWAVLKSRPRREQVGLIHNRYQVSSVELVELLIQKGIEEVRRDPRRGVEIAALAVDGLESLAGTVSDFELRQLEVRAYAWLANAHRLALDFPEAERVLRRGEESLRPDCSLRSRTELALVKSALRMSQRRMDESLKLANQVVSAMASVEDPVFRMRCWLHRAHLYHHMGKTAESTTDLWRAYGLSDQVDDGYLLSALYQMLSLRMALDGKHREAVRFLPVARSFCEQLGLANVMCYLEWTEGLLNQDLGNAEAAEDQLRQARSGFYEQGNSYIGGLVALDLAIFCAAQGRSSDCSELATEVIEIFDSLKVSHEVVKAIHVLQQSMTADEISKATLQQFRAALSKTPSRPMAV